MSLTIERVDVAIDANPILADVNLDVGAIETVALLGPSGSGKTTLLRAIAGIVPLSAGVIRWEGQDLADISTHERRLGMVFQDYALFPHLSVGRNVAFGLEIRGLPTERPVEEALEMVGLRGLSNRTIEGLSGGEQQRVALARALITRPRLMLLDEPLGALDAALRERLIEELRGLLAELPAVYVTHDREEAMAIADRIALMRDGTIVRVDPPARIWDEPRDTWTAAFIGHENVFERSYVPEQTITEHPGGAHVVAVADRRFTRGLWHTTYRLDDGRTLTALIQVPAPGTSARIDFQEHPLASPGQPSPTNL